MKNEKPEEFLYRHVIWDWNGTLINDVRLSYELLVEILKEEGLGSLTFDGWRNEMFFPIREYYMGLAPNHDEAGIARMMVNWGQRYEKRRAGCALHAGAREILDKINERGISQSILSAHTQVELSEAVHELGVTSCFEHVIGLGSGNGGESKIETGRKLVAAVGHAKTLAPRDHVIIGDSSHDAEVAQALGIDCILVAAGAFSGPRLEALGFPVFGTLEDLNRSYF